MGSVTVTGEEWSEMERRIAAAEAGVADVVEALPTRLATTRADRGASMRDVAEQTGLPVSTIHKAEHGGDIRLSTVVALLRWLT